MAASTLATFALAASKFALACPTCASNVAGSIRAISWPFFTGELKSTYMLYRSRNLGTHENGGHRIYSAGGGNSCQDITPGNSFRPESQFVPFISEVKEGDCAQYHQDQNAGDD